MLMGNIKNFKAFTLVELLVVIAIIGLLSTIVLVSTSGLRDRADLAKNLQWSESIDSLLGANAVAVWNMDENPAIHNSTIFDLSGWGNNGTLSTGDGSTSKSVIGVVNNALYFDGSNDYVILPATESLDLTTDISFTVSVWVNGIPTPQDTLVRESSVICWSPTDLRGIGLDLTGEGSSSVGRYTFKMRNSTDSSYLTTISSWANKWVNLVAIYNKDTNKMRLYANGVLQGEMNGTATLSAGAGRRRIGSALIIAGNGSYFHGTIDEVRVYDTALTTVQVQSQYYVGWKRLLAKGLINKKEYQIGLVVK
jgi:prepilin-type N-terminal cleavage/methylation domain-containing protein